MLVYGARILQTDLTELLLERDNFEMRAVDYTGLTIVWNLHVPNKELDCAVARRAEAMVKP